MSDTRNLTGTCHDLRMKFIYRIKSEASECRHSPKWTEYLEQERAVLQENISGNEAGCDISRTGMGNAKITFFRRKVVKGMNEKFLKVEDIMEILGISKSAAYKLMRELNDEMVKKVYIAIRGRVNRKYFEERFYGMSDAG